VDGTGAAYIAGYTSSGDFPTTSGSFQANFAGGFQDAFVVKLNATGSTAIYATLLGGNGNDLARGVAVDSFGCAYITGYTDSPNFPVLNALLPTYRGGSGDAYVTKLNASGTGIIYSTYLGGSSVDYGSGIAVDSSGAAYVAGATYSSNFPTTSGAFRTTPAGNYDAFVAKLSSSGNSLVYSTYLGGSGVEEAGCIAVDSQGNASVAGFTGSLDFPLQLAYQSVYRGSLDAFLTKFNASGTALLFSTYLGGAGDDRAYGVAVDPAGNISVIGMTSSRNFPTTASAVQTAIGGSYDAFAVRFATNQPPATVSVSPSSGSGLSQTFNFTVSDPDGYADLKGMMVLIYGSKACFIYYHLPTNSFSLAQDDGTTWQGLLPVGSSGSQQNSQCQVSAAGASATAVATNLTLTLPITFKPAFAGPKSIYLYTEDQSGLAAGWDLRGAWTVPGL
jgi:hypothetical protein